MAPPIRQLDFDVLPPSALSSLFSLAPSSPSIDPPLPMRSTTPFGLNQQTWQQLKADVKKGPCKRLEILAKTLALPADHLFLREDPKLAAKLSTMMLRQWSREKLLNKKTLLNIVEQFQKHKVYRRGTPIEKVIVHCVDGTVPFNKQLLILQSDYFNRHFASSVGTETDKYQIRLLELDNFHKATVELFKDKLYDGTWPALDPDGGLTTIQTAVEVIKLTHMDQLTDGFDLYVSRLKTFLDTYVIKNEEQLEQTLELLTPLIPINKELTSLYILAIERYIGQKLELRPIVDSPHYLVSINQLPLMDISRKHLFSIGSHSAAPSLNSPQVLPIYPGKSAILVHLNGNWTDLFLQGDSILKYEMSFNALQANALIQEFTLLGDKDLSIRLSIKCNNFLLGQPLINKQIIDYFAAHKVSVKEISFLSTIYLDDIHQIRAAFKIIDTHNKISEPYRSFISRIIAAGHAEAAKFDPNEIITRGIESPIPPSLSLAPALSLSPSSSLSSTPSPQVKNVVSKALLQLVKGIYVSSEFNLDAVAMLPFYPEELLQSLTQVCLRHDFEVEQRKIVLEAILEACPHLETLELPFPGTVLHDTLGPDKQKNYYYESTSFVELLEIIKKGPAIKELFFSAPSTLSNKDKDYVDIEVTEKLIETLQDAPRLKFLHLFDMAIGKDSTWFMEKHSSSLESVKAALLKTKAMQNYEFSRYYSESQNPTYIAFKVRENTAPSSSSSPSSSSPPPITGLDEVD